MMKICSKCKLEKELNSVNFEPRKNTIDGFRNQCRDCRNKMRKDRYLYSDKLWTKEEKDILKEHYPFLSSKEISENLLNKRTPEQITDYATKKLNLHKNEDFHNGWDKEQINYLISNYCNFNVSLEEMSEFLRKSNATITAMANSLGVFREKEDKWSKKEIDIIKSHYPNMGTIKFRDLYMKDRTIQEITKFANDNDIYKLTPVLKEIRINNAINNLKEVNNKKEPTRPEKYIIELLNKLNIEYEFQKFSKYYWLDFYLPNSNLIIEVQGDYFHCNPLKNLNYNKIDKNKILAKDKRKHSYFKNKGIEILYLWESDILKSINKCELLINKYINNRGNLNDYHSYNYSMKDNILIELDSKITIGY